MSAHDARHGIYVGQTIAGKYVVEAVLGAGGMGVVVRARHAVLGSRVAIKFMHPELATNTEMRARFSGEAERVAQMQSEHVVRVLDIGELPSGAPFIVMEYVEGKDLSTILLERGPLPVIEAVDYLLQACEGIAEAHSRGIIHRDVKPANLVVARQHDGSTIVKVLDFGIAKTLVPGEGSKLTSTSAMMGSPYYSAPEQLESASRADQRADIWALGVTLHELLTGQGPFDGASQASIIAAIMTMPPVALRRHRPDLAENLEWIVARCLEKEPNRRFRRVVDLAEHLAVHGSPAAHASLASIAGIPGQQRTNTVVMPSVPAPRQSTPAPYQSQPSPAYQSQPSPAYQSNPAPGFGAGAPAQGVGMRGSAPVAARASAGRGLIVAAVVATVVVVAAIIVAVVLASSSPEPPPLPPPPPELVHPSVAPAEAPAHPR
ncbi:MAG TPA: serine/threonine-protein kinase [Polyangiaceae bacterium]|jgi:serine/threonine-protein kinase|nr:serine/threonine-protein kinase [Polyangiaceae bacterium]